MAMRLKFLTHFPLWESKRLNFEESNPVIDGIKLYAKDNILELNREKKNGRLEVKAITKRQFCHTMDPFQICEIRTMRLDGLVVLLIQAL